MTKNLKKKPAKKSEFYYLIDNQSKDLCVEIRRSGERTLPRIKRASVFDLMSIRSPRVAAGIKPKDIQALMHLYVNQASNSDRVILAGKAGYSALEKMIATGRCYWLHGSDKALSLKKKRTGRLSWQAMNNGDLIPSLTVSPPASFILPLNPPVYLEARTMDCGPIDVCVPKPLIDDWFNCPPLKESEVISFGNRLTKRFPNEQIPIPQSLQVEHLTKVEPKPILSIHEEKLIPDPDNPSLEPIVIQVLKLEYDYGVTTIHWAHKEKELSLVENNTLYRIERNRDFEDGILKALMDLGVCMVYELYPSHILDKCEKDLTLRPHGPYDWSQLINEKLPTLEKSGWKVSFEESLSFVNIDEHQWYSELTPTAMEWFELEAGFEVDGKRLNLLPVMRDLMAEFVDTPLEELKKHLENRHITVPVGDGRHALIPGEKLYPYLQNLYELSTPEILNKKGRLRLNKWRVAEVLELENLSNEPWDLGDRLRTFARHANDHLNLSPLLPPSGLNAKLRPYQQIGLAWMQCLRDNALAGILADDMGLGKTVQTLAHLLYEKQAGRLKNGALIIVPTSLISNWSEEIQRFAPELDFLCMYGSERKENFKNIGKTAITLTSYPLIARDIEQYQKHPFTYIILDEAQYIKNPKTQASKNVCLLQAEHRLCLTGTPMENHLGEIWSIFNFLMPGFLGDQKSFNQFFRTPIEKYGQKKPANILNNRIAPFLMRRKKDEVAPELPPKTEIIRNLELTAKQKELYESVRIKLASKVNSAIKAKGVARSQIVILDALLKLRQVCCDPRLVSKRKGKLEDSTKLVAFMELVDKLLEEDRKALVFSQFTSMLDLIIPELEKRNIPYLKLTGATKNRGELTKQFQNGETPLFLISLKAGGTGLNLTAADTVIHYDPWWNPSVENQATDRSHRIGQDKPIFVYKLLTQNTVESKILRMQKQKSELIEGILAESFNNKLKFDEKVICDLFGSL